MKTVMGCVAMALLGLLGLHLHHGHLLHGGAGLLQCFVGILSSQAKLRTQLRQQHGGLGCWACHHFPAVQNVAKLADGTQ